MPKYMLYQKMKCFVLLLALLFSLIKVSRADTAEGFYLRILPDSVVVGRQSINGRATIATLPRATLHNYHLADYIGLPRDKQLVYIHAMWGGRERTHNATATKLRAQPVSRVLSIIWHTDALGYTRSWELAIQQGEDIGGLVARYLASCNDEGNYLLCHSMGHRILQGIYRADDAERVRFQAVFFAAPDLDTDVFQEELRLLPRQTDRFLLYANDRDMALRLSKLLRGRRRLGRDILQAISWPDKLELIDVTDSAHNGSDWLTGHLYFRKNPMVLRDIAAVIDEREDSRTAKRSAVDATVLYLP